MPYLIGSMICSAAVANLFKSLEKRAVPLHRVLLVNYIAATVIAFFRTATVQWGTVDFLLPSAPPAGLFLISMAAGSLFIGSYYLLGRAMRHLGVGISVSMMRLSAVIPVGASILVFSESPTRVQMAGLALALLILPLAAPCQSRRERAWETKNRPKDSDCGVLQVPVNQAGSAASAFGWGLFLFLAFGVTDLSMKVQRELYPGFHDFFLFLVFMTSLAISMAINLSPPVRAGQSQGPMLNQAPVAGIVLGALNFGSSLFFVKALVEIEGLTAYPLNGMGIILLTFATGTIIWKEKTHSRQKLFALLACGAIWLIR